MDEKKLDKLAAELAKDLRTESDLSDLSRILLKKTIERALRSELSEHLGYEKHSIEGRNISNSRNGSSRKTIKTDSGELELEIPRIEKAPLVHNW